MRGILEQDIQKAILDYLKYKKIYSWKSPSTGLYDPTRKIFRKNKGIKTVDILGILPSGKFLAIEVKRKPNKPTPDQLEFIDNINRNNGLAFVAYSFTEVEEKLREYAS